MKKIVSFIIIMSMVALVLAGCSGSSHKGKYYKESDAESYIELRGNDLFTVVEDDMTIDGEYSIEGTDIKFTIMGFVSGGTIEGDTIIDPDGVRWTKK